MKKTIITVLVALLLLSFLTVASVSANDYKVNYNTNTSYSNSIYFRRLNAVELTGNYATDILNVAFSQEGYHESNSSSDMTGYSDGNKNYTEYGYCAGVNGEPWCASFISWCARRARIPKEVLHTSVYACASYFGAEFRKSGEYTPKAGDIIIFDWVKDGLCTLMPIEAHGDHVSLVYRVSGDTVYYIDGNGTDLQGNDANDVRCHSRKISDENIKGYGVYTDKAADISLVKRTYVFGQYSDVDETLWYGYEAQQTIKTAFELGLVSGKSPTTFAPNGELLVCEALTLAARVFSRQSEDNYLFEQSEGNFWYDCYLNYCIENGIISVERFSSDDMFRPATRREMAQIFAYALPQSKLTAINNISTIPDIHSGSDGEKEILLLYNAGILGGGDEYGTFYPETAITRAEATAIITREAVCDLRLNLSLLPVFTKNSQLT